MNLPTNTKPWIQGAVVGAIAAAVIGFSWGGWVTGGSADKRVAVATHDATVTALASICAERFRAQADAPAKLAELTKTSSWDRGSFIERSGFALMPGEKSADFGCRPRLRREPRRGNAEDLNGHSAGHSGVMPASCATFFQRVISAAM